MPPAWRENSFPAWKSYAPTGRSTAPGSRISPNRSASTCTGSGRKRSPDRLTGLNPDGGSLAMTSPLAGEFLGTMILVLLGDGVVAAVLLKRSKAEGSGWMVITSGWAFAVMAGVFTAVACGSSDAHINPAVTLGFAVETGQFAKFAPYLIAQMAGAFVGAILVWLHFLPHWKETESKDFKLLCFCTVPAIRNFIANLISEVIATFVLVFVVAAIFSKAVAGSGLVPGLGAYLVAALV